MELVSSDLFDRGRRLALRLAQEPSPTVLLHGDLTPANILHGGEQRGLVAIDPAPCMGDPAFDIVDLVFWQAGDLEMIRSRAELLAKADGVDATRLLDWCTAFAGMAAPPSVRDTGALPPVNHARPGRGGAPPEVRRLFGELFQIVGL